ncbi:MAG: hypothetical protein V2B19_12300 [Pseudomonadota bacterium]
MDIHLAQALWILDLLAIDHLPEVALDALEVGLDTPALRMLAGLVSNEVEDAPQIFTQALKELGLPMLSRRDAACIYAISVSKQILNGELSPQDGADKLWEASIRVNNPDFHELDTFIYADSELQSRPEDQDFFSREILKEARVWASKHDI